MNPKIKEVLQEFYKTRKDRVAFIFLGGSACFSYINNPHNLVIYVV